MMEQLLQDIVVSQLFAFLLIFMRLGTALMIMPGVGDSFVSQQSRLLFALAFSFVMTPFLAPNLPTMPSGAIPFALLLTTEFFVGAFMGTMMRILLTALDTAGSVISLQMGLSNATLLNPATSSQGSVTGAFYSILGVTLILTTDMHHMMLASLVESYSSFPSGAPLPAMGDLAGAVGHAVAVAFRIGVQIAMPFIVVGTLLQVGFGLLGRLMPQLQIFFLVLPIQIFLCLVLFAMTISVGIMYWLNTYDAAIASGFAP